MDELLLESGDKVLLEDGDNVLLESATGVGAVPLIVFHLQMQGMA